MEERFKDSQDAAEAEVSATPSTRIHNGTLPLACSH